MKERILTISTSVILTVAIVNTMGLTPIVDHHELNLDLQASGIPIGTIVAWSGNPAFLPDNWKVCDGSPYPKDTYDNLYKIVATYWTKDAGLNEDLFNIPDLRGIFLRGVNGARDDKFADPDREERESLLENNMTDVGSFQLDEFGEHTHKFTKGNNRFSQAASPSVFGSAYSGETPTIENKSALNTSGGAETRPKNAYVYWIIKVK